MACPFILFGFIFISSLSFKSVGGQQFYNVTIDDNDARIRYSGNWSRLPQSDLDGGGSYMVANDPTASAVVEFEGVAVYYLLPLWSYDLTTELQLDTQIPQIIAMGDVGSPLLSDGTSETGRSQAVWGVAGLENRVHQLSISVPPGSQSAILDGLIVTQVDAKGSFQTPQTSVNNVQVTPVATVQDTRTSYLTTKTSSSDSFSRTEHVNVPTIGICAGFGFMVLGSSLSFLIYRHRQTRGHHAGRKLVVDLENDFPPFPKAPRSSYIRPCSSPGSNALIISARTPSDSNKALPQLPSIQNTSLATSRRTALDQPPPAYHDCINTYKNCRETLRYSKISSLSRLSQLSPPPSFNASNATNPLYDVRHEYLGQ